MTTGHELADDSLDSGPRHSKLVSHLRNGSPHISEVFSRPKVQANYSDGLLRRVGSVLALGQVDGACDTAMNSRRRWRLEVERRHLAQLLVGQILTWPEVDSCELEVRFSCVCHLSFKLRNEPYLAPDSNLGFKSQVLQNPKPARCDTHYKHRDT